MAKVTGVMRNSIVKKFIRKGDEIVSFNGRKFVDVLDYIYADSLEKGTIEILRGDKTLSVQYLKNNDFDTLGLTFDKSIEIVPKTCNNNCIFCFVQQLPKGLRETLYVKDDDYRLSFISGSYITCTNLKESDIERIIDYKLSPLYVSVHATDIEVRKFLLGIKKVSNQMEILERLIKNGIDIHAQIVLVGGINDGDVLSKSLTDLYNVGVKTVAVVPVGLTNHRQGKYNISPITEEQAKDAIKKCQSFYQEKGGFCYCADEMYQIANQPIPSAEYYGEYEQIENGVGLIAKFIDELEYALSNAPNKVKNKTVGIFTGESGYSTMQRAKELIESKYSNVKLNVYVVKNDFFGRSVTVTGLITATDIIKQYGGKEYKEDYFMIPAVMLKEFEDVFLDGKNVKELSKSIGKKIIVNRCDGEDYLNKIIYGDKKWQNR